MKNLVTFEQYADLFKSESEQIWCDTLFAIANKCGFEQTLFAVLKNKYEPLENAFIRSNYSSDWRSTYDDKKLGYVDPTVDHCLTSTIPLIWTSEAFKNPDQKNMYEEATSYGLRSGVIFPIHGANGEFGMFTFVSETLNNSRSKKDLLNIMPTLSIIRDYAFESSKTFIANHSYKDVRLTPRELEVLKWAMVGKSSWEKSRILSCSESTINFHMSNIRRKFDASTVQQAIIKAIRLGIIQP